MGEVVELEIPARPDYLAVARLVVSAAAALGPRLSEARLDDLRLAVSEATTNAIDAHRASGRDDRVAIRCRVEPTRIEVEVRDRGSGFDVDALRAHPPVSDPARLQFERGLGIPLIRVLTDESDFVPSESGTTVRMVVSDRGRERGTGRIA